MEMGNEEGVLIEEDQPLKKPSIFGVIMNPTEQFTRLREKPVILFPLIIVTLLTLIGTYLMIQGVDFTADDPNMSGIPADELAMVETIAKAGAVAMGIIVPIFAILISTVIYLIVAKIARSEVSFKQLFSLNTFIYFISAISLLLNGIAVFLTGAGEQVLFTSLNSIVDADGILGAFLNQIEVFSIWALILGAIGLQVVAKFSKVLSWSVVITLFVIGIIFAMVGAGVSSMFGAF